MIIMQTWHLCHFDSILVNFYTKYYFTNLFYTNNLHFDMTFGKIFARAVSMEVLQHNSCAYGNIFCINVSMLRKRIKFFKTF